MARNRSFLIFNPTMKAQDGHFYNYDTAIATAAKPFFQYIEIFADKAFVVPIDAPCKIAPILNIVPISSLKKLANNVFSILRIFRKKKEVHHSNATIIAEVPTSIIHLGRWLNFIDITVGLYKIISAQRKKNTDSIDVFIEHAHIGEVYGVGFIAKKIKLLTTKPIIFHLVMRYTPDMMFPKAVVDRKFITIIQNLIESKAPLVYFYTDSEQLSFEYTKLFPKASEEQFKTLPIPVLLDGAVKKQVSNDGKICASLLGPPRIEKGFDNLPEIISSLSKCANIKIAVQTTKSPTDPRIANRTKWLHSFPKDSFTVEILEGPVAENIYFSWFTKTDILLLPYISPRYANSTSGVFVEALYFLAPIITTKGTWMAKKITEALQNGLKIGEIVDDMSQFGEKAEIIIANMERYRKDMQIYLSGWKKFHNSEVLVKMLVEK